MSDELKPCPFCGGSAIHTQGLEPFSDNHFIDCAVCGVSTKIFNSARSAIAAWNHRAIPPTGDAAGKDGAVAWRWKVEIGGVQCWEYARIPPVGANAEPLYARPSTAAGKDSVDAARYRMVRQAAYQFGVSNPRPDELDDDVDAAIASLTKTADGEKQW